MSDGNYPPEHHVLRDLDFEVETTSRRSLARIRLVGDGTESGEGVELGALLTVGDLLAGARSLGSVAPDWVATSNLSFHLARSIPVGELWMSATSLRAGRTTVLVALDARIDDQDGERLGEGVVSFSRLPRRDSNLTIEHGDDAIGWYSWPSRDGQQVGVGGTLRRSIGCTITDAGAGMTRTEVGRYVRNSFGAVNGGVIATIVETAALACAHGHANTGDWERVVTDIALHYVAQGKVGPIETTATTLRGPTDARSGSSRLRVEVTDAGNPSGDRLMVVAHVGVASRV